MINPVWTEEELSKLKEMRQAKIRPQHMMPKLPGRTLNAIRRQLSILHINDEDYEYLPRNKSMRPPRNSPHKGETTCLGCQERFISWDKRKNRQCPSCTGRHIDGDWLQDQDRIRANAHF